MATRLSPDQTPEGWSRAAVQYERVIIDITRPFAVQAIDRVGIHAGDRVIDVACGPGTASFAAAERGASVLATDYAPDMIERLREAIRIRGDTGVEPRIMDGQALEVPDGSFDVALCVFGLMFFPDQEAGFRELHRVLRPGGRAAVVTWGPPERNPGITLQREAALAAIPDLPVPEGVPAIFTLSDAQALADRMRAAGFADVTVDAAPGQWTFETPEGEWDLMSASPVFEAIQAFAGERVGLVRDELLRLVRARFGTGPVRFPCEALIAVGTRASS